GNITVTTPAGNEVSGTSGSGFASSITVAYSEGSIAATTKYVHFKQTAAQSYTGNITNAGSGAATQNVEVSGTCVTPSLSVTPTSLSFGNVTVNTTSAEKTYSISGSNLSPVSGSITITAPSGYEVSPTSGSGFASSITV